MIGIELTLFMLNGTGLLYKYVKSLTESFSHPLFHAVDGTNKDTIKDSWTSGIPSCNVLISFQVMPVVKVQKGFEVSSHMA